MLGSFRDLKDSVSKEIPQKMLDYFNSQAPNGYRYEYAEGDHAFCRLKPDSEDAEPLPLEGIHILFNDRQLSELGSLVDDYHAVASYIGNSLDEFDADASSAKMTFPGEEVPFFNLIKRADGNVAPKDGRIRIRAVPQEFDLPFELDGGVLPVHFFQVRSSAPFVRRYQSRGSALVITLFIGQEGNPSCYEISFDPSQEKTVSGCYRTAQLNLEIARGTARVQGAGAFGPSHGQDDIRRAEDNVDFWKKALEVQIKLGVMFDPGKRMSPDDVSTIIRLHEGIVKGRAVGLGYRPESLTYVAEGDEEVPMNKVLLLMVPRIEHYCIMGADFAVRAVVGLSGVSLDGVVRENGNEKEYSLSYSEDYQCSVLYTLPGQTDDSPENVDIIKKVLTEPLSDGAHY